MQKNAKIFVPKPKTDHLRHFSMRKGFRLFTDYSLNLLTHFLRRNLITKNQQITKKRKWVKFARFALLELEIGG